MNSFEEEIINVNQYIYNNKKKFNIEIGETIKDIRNKNSISLEEFSLKSLMDKKQLLQIESGTNGITLNKFTIICNSLNVSPDILLEKFLYTNKLKEDKLFYELQNGKNLSRNLINFLKIK